MKCKSASAMCAAMWFDEYIKGFAPSERRYYANIMLCRANLASAYASNKHDKKWGQEMAAVITAYLEDKEV